jgi:ABC-type polysaccharide/polyol phosphate export permease
MKYICALFNFLFDIWENRVLLWDLTKKDLRQRYIGSYLGILWAFIQPTITVFIFWFVFQVGFKSGPTATGVPFILWLVSGMFPWFFFNDSLSAATGSVCANSYLVKKVVFKVRLLPIIQIISALLIHFFFIALLFLMLFAYGYLPSIYNLQVVYYLLATICIVLGLSWITSALCVFSRDIGQLVGMCLQFLFWGTPIFWDIAMMPHKLAQLLMLNPLYYIINGYRDSFINHVCFWQHQWLTVYFWIVTFIIMLFGAWLFKKLRPQFADVL